VAPGCAEEDASSCPVTQVPVPRWFGIPNGGAYAMGRACQMLPPTYIHAIKPLVHRFKRHPLLLYYLQRSQSHNALHVVSINLSAPSFDAGSNICMSLVLGLLFVVFALLQYMKAVVWKLHTVLSKKEIKRLEGYARYTQAGLAG